MKMIELYDLEQCEKCGAIIVDTRGHQHWHEQTEELLENLLTHMQTVEEAVKAVAKIL